MCMCVLAWKSVLLILADWPAHTRLTALFPGLPSWAGTRKVKPNWILLRQETVSGSGCPSCRPTNSVKALKALTGQQYVKMSVC